MPRVVLGRERQHREVLAERPDHEHGAVLALLGIVLVGDPGPHHLARLAVAVGMRLVADPQDVGRRHRRRRTAQPRQQTAEHSSAMYSAPRRGQLDRGSDWSAVVDLWKPGPAAPTVRTWRAAVVVAGAAGLLISLDTTVNIA